MTSPHYLYSASACAELDRVATESFAIPGYTLMRRAGQCLMDTIESMMPGVGTMLVLCGAGNNAGDGYVLARLALQKRWRVHVVTLIDVEKLNGEAKQACEDWLSIGGEVHEYNKQQIPQHDLIVDALLGTGLSREVGGDWREVVEWINAGDRPVVSVDIPSGLLADTGVPAGCSVRADTTVTFIARKIGLYTGSGAEYCGRVVFNDLGVPKELYERVKPRALLMRAAQLGQRLPVRQRDMHKGHNGHVLVIGGDFGMAGAVKLCAQAALRSGSGLVSVLTRTQHVSAIVSKRPEIMVNGCDDGHVPQHLLDSASVIVIGPGLGQNDWGRSLLSEVLAIKKPAVLDADALNLLPEVDARKTDCNVLTPHPGEASHLLKSSTADIQQDRYRSAQLLQQAFGGVVVLKGSGTIVQGSKGLPAVCRFGNPGMATAGMGDVLSGIIAAMMSQGLAPETAAETGVLVHALAADQAAGSGERGMIASDVIDQLRSIVNP